MSVSRRFDVLFTEYNYMTSNHLCLGLTSLIFILVTATTIGTAQPTQEVFKQPVREVFKEDWSQLKNDAPAWLQDAKFGIYFHWGVYCVPAFNSEWYSRSMYIPGTSPYRHQIEQHGSLKNFGYKDFIPLFKAPNFNADEWTDLFVKAGARFAGPVAEHADGFSMWDSKVNSWNARKMGPHKDVVAQMKAAINKRGLKFIATFHHQWQWGWYPAFDSTTDASDPRYAGLYGPKTSIAAWKQSDTAERPNAAFCKQWLEKVNEVVSNYNPDILYFDSRLAHIGEVYRKEMVTTYFNQGGNKDQKVILYKGRDLPQGTGVVTHEKSRVNQLSKDTWLTEEPITGYSWSYTEDIKLRPANDILNGLIDIVSKNGVYMLNICPMADGTIPQDQRDILLTIGGWLKKYGESIYGIRPWLVYGEGPAKEEADKPQVEDRKRKRYLELKFTQEDVRYTSKGNTVYAIVMGKPIAGSQLLLTAFTNNTKKITRVTMLSSGTKLNWKQEAGGLKLQLPTSSITGELPQVFKIETTL